MLFPVNLKKNLNYQYFVVYVVHCDRSKNRNAKAGVLYDRSVFETRRAVRYNNIYLALHIPVPEHTCSEVELSIRCFARMYFGVVLLVTFNNIQGYSKWLSGF